MAEEPDDPDRDAIVRRRNRFVAMALSGVAVASMGACAEPCLRPAVDASGRDSGADASPMPCLSDAGRPRPDAGPRDAGPGDAASDAGAEGDAGASDAGDAAPLPCLTAVP